MVFYSKGWTAIRSAPRTSTAMRLSNKLKVLEKLQRSEVARGPLLGCCIRTNHFHRGERPLDCARSLSGSLLNHEISTGQSIDERWGGAYETVSFSRHTGRLEKLDNVLHTFWLWRDDGKIDFQPRFYFARYFDELLVLRSAEYEAGENRTITRLKSHSLELVPSLLRSVRDDDELKIGHVDFSYDHVCCHVWFPGAPGSVLPRAAIVLAAPRGSSYDIDLSVAETVHSVCACRAIQWRTSSNRRNGRLQYLVIFTAK